MNAAAASGTMGPPGLPGGLGGMGQHPAMQPGVSLAAGMLSMANSLGPMPPGFLPPLPPGLKMDEKVVSAMSASATANNNDERLNVRDGCHYLFEQIILLLIYLFIYVATSFRQPKRLEALPFFPISRRTSSFS